jgi:ribosomal protein S18 acetylase RimI-like enzyme
MIEVSEVRHVDGELVEAFARLVPQLSSTSPAPTAEDLERLVASDSTILFVAKGAGTIVGTLTLVVVRIPTGVRARIEDVVVDETARGQGVGAALSEAALRRAAERGAKTVDLTSRPERAAANRLYERLGFERRDTTVYRYRL